MNVCTVSSLLLLVITFNGLAGSKKNDRLSSGSGKLPRCEVYRGRLCAKYIKNVTIFLKPTQTQRQMEQKLRVAFGYFPKFLSEQCTRYAYPALCLYAFPPCDATVDYPKRRQFCQDECEALQQHICEHEFNYGRGYMANLVPSCSKMPSTDSPEHEKCIRLNVKIDKPVFKLQLQNVTAGVGETVVLKCKVKSSKIVPRITWYKDGQIIQPGHPSYKIHLFRHRSRMKIRHVKLEDRGKYKCEVTNVAWTVSSESWITINITGFKRNITTERCGVLQPSSVCAPYLKNQIVYFDNAHKEYNSEHLILRALKNFHGSSRCTDFALSAMCYHFFPSCVRGVVKYRLCKEDCMKVKNQFCQKMVPASFPQCSLLPKMFSEDGLSCEIFKYVDKPVFKLQLRNVTAGIGETIVLKCKVKSSKIDPTLTWYKDGKIIESDHPFYKIYLFRYSSRMKIRKLHLEDNGKYKCEVANSAWTVSSESWITVNTTGFTGNETFPRCGILQPSSVCAPYIKNQSVYFEDAQTEYNSEHLIRAAMRNFHGSSRCKNFTSFAMCYHFFPSCIRGIMKHRLCKDDCLKVRNEYCQNVVPSSFPQCSKLPKIFLRDGQYCEIFRYEPETKEKRCGVYNGNNFCGKYLANQAIYFSDMQKQYELERKLSRYLSKSIVSEKCLTFGVPAMCYHLFPVCDQGVKKSRLCREECERLKAETCSTEVALIKQISATHVKTMFPNCTHLPVAGQEAGKFCNQHQNSTVSTSPATSMYDLDHDCYNETGVEYLGSYNTSYSGKACISWNIPRPKSFWSHNYCRNPNEEGVAPWCYVTKGIKEYCAVKKCEIVTKALEGSGGDTSLGRTIYVVIAIVAVILLGCVTVIVYWKVQNSKENPDVSPAGSAVPFAKSSSTQLNETKENIEIKSFVMKEIMSRGKVKCISRMWEGHFCKVFKGELVNDKGNSNMNIVIKALSNDATAIEKEIFTEETNLLCHLQHVNILGLLGISPNQDFVVFEYLSEIDVHQFLELKSREHNDADRPGVEVLLRFAKQVANGMKYLAEFNYVHGDVAARNCFVCEDGVNVKISMLGMGSYAYPADYELLGEDSAIFPIRWMSPESLQTLSLTSVNDVWAFGVTLWEIFSFGRRPYDQCSNTEVIEKIADHELLNHSQDWPSTVRSLIDECCSITPTARPNFDKIYENLNNEYMILADDTIEVRL